MEPPISILSETGALLILGQHKRQLLVVYAMKYPNQRYLHTRGYSIRYTGIPYRSHIDGL